MGHTNLGKKKEKLLLTPAAFTDQFCVRRLLQHSMAQHGAWGPE